MTKKALMLSGIRWNTTIQRHHAVASHLITMGYEVDFIEGIVSSRFGIKKLYLKLLNRLLSKGSSHTVVPNNRVNILPAGLLNPDGGIFRLFNDWLLSRLYKKIGSHYDVIINYLPVETTLKIIENVSHDMLIYDCVRDFANWGGYPDNVQEIEKEMIEMSETVLVDSYFLFDKLTRKYSAAKVVQMLPMLKVGQADILERGVAPFAVKNITYVGQIGDHIDLDALKVLLDQGYILHHFGNSLVEIDSRIIAHGFISDPRQLASKIIEYSDALIIPYRGNMDGVIPAKLFECLATNLPVYISSFYDSRILSDMLYVYDRPADLPSLVKGYSKKDHKYKNNKSIKYLIEHHAQNEILKLETVLRGDG